MSNSKQSYLSENSLGALTYIAAIPAIFLLVIPRFKKSPSVRFHAWQAIELAITTIVITYALAVSLVSRPLEFMGIIWMVWFGLALTGWLCGIMALHGKKARLPLIGAWAERLAKSNLVPVRAVTRTLVPDGAREFLR